MAKKKTSKVEKLLRRADKIRVRVFSDSYWNPLGPNSEDYDDMWPGPDLHGDPAFTGITLRDFVEVSHILIQPPGQRAIGFNDISFEDFQTWLDILGGTGDTVTEEICNYDTINYFRIERVDD